MSEIMTYTKKMFDPLHPNTELIDIEDIAHALSMLCRANGHFKSFYSVGQHSVNCMMEAKTRGYAERIQLACLLHDASEAYLSDVTRPVKAELPRYKEIEAPLQETIWNKWLDEPLTEEERKQVFDIDDAILAHEFLNLMGASIVEKMPEIASTPQFAFTGFDACKQQFLRLFCQLTTGQKKCSLTIRLETEKDYRAVEELTREAFWNVYKPGADEHYYVHQMRNHPDFIPELAFVLELDGRIVGNIMYTKAWLESEAGNRKEILSFGPLCVAPEYQRQKFGKILIEHSFEVARKMGYDVNINFGNPGNYVSRGFVSCKKKNVSFVVDGNFPTALLVCELVPGALDGGKWMYIPSTAADCCEDTAAVESFDATFPPKEKKWMPSQEEFYIYRHSSVVR